MNKDAEGRWKVGMSNIKLKMRVKTEVIRRQGPWCSLEAVEFATLAWVDWFNTRQLPEPIGYLPPAEYEVVYYQQAAVA